MRPAHSRPRLAALAIAWLALTTGAVLSSCYTPPPTATAYVATPTPLPPTPTSFLATLTPAAPAPNPAPTLPGHQRN